MSDLHSCHAPITVAIVSKNHLVRIGLQAALSAQQHMQLVGEANGAHEAETLVSREQPHVLVIEMETDLDVRELVRSVKTSVPRTRIILLSSIEDKAHIVGSVSSGIDGIVLTIQPAVVLLATISHVCGLPDATTVYERRTRRRLQCTEPSIDDDPPPRLSATSPDTSLTGREREIVCLIGQALSNKDIAERLCISSVTVRHHLTSIFGKFDVNSRQKLLLRAYEYGLLKVEAHH